MDDALGDISLQDSGDEMLSSHSDQCPVCLMSLKEQLLGTPNNCPHVFCFECIQEWAKVRSTQWSLWLQAADFIAKSAACNHLLSVMMHGFSAKYNT